MINSQKKIRRPYVASCQARYTHLRNRLEPELLDSHKSFSPHWYVYATPSALQHDQGNVFVANSRLAPSKVGGGDDLGRHQVAQKARVEFASAESAGSRNKMPKALTLEGFLQPRIVSTTVAQEACTVTQTHTWSHGGELVPAVRCLKRV